MKNEEIKLSASSIKFDEETIKAILAGRKTQTRVAVPLEITGVTDIYNSKSEGYPSIEIDGERVEVETQGKYKVGDTFYVREPFAEIFIDEDGNIHDTPVRILYLADGTAYSTTWMEENKEEIRFPWKSAIHMLKEHARIFLKITSVKVERLKDIEHEDILAEGMDFHTYQMEEKAKWYGNDQHGEVDYCEDLANEWFKTMWNKTVKDHHRWEYNPWVFVYEFERIHND